MKPPAWFERSMSHKPWRPSQLRWVMQDLAGIARQPEQDHRTHLRATLEWVCRAQDTCRSTSSGHVPAGWTFESGWLSLSADATGWLIETLLPAADYLAWPHLAERASDMLDALAAQVDGTSAGQIHGLIAGYIQLGRTEFLMHAVRSSHVLGDMPMTSVLQHAQAAHAVATVGVIAGESKLLETAQRHLQAVLAQQTPCGWFSSSGAPASTMELAGILRSLIEVARLLDDAEAQLAALRTAQGLRGQLHREGRLAGAFDDGWMPAASYVSVHGLAQLAGCWLRLAQELQEGHWRDAAWRAVAWVKRCQRTLGRDLALRDALPSGVPIWSGPAAFSIDTLSAKYFADALMMDMVGIAVPPEVPERKA